MRRILLCFILIGFSSVVLAQIPQCPNTAFVGLGNNDDLSHTYYDPSSNTVFGVGYFKDTITVGASQFYSASAGGYGKYIVEMDVNGTLLNSFQVAATNNLLEMPGGSGFFEPGIGVTPKALIVPNVFKDVNGVYIFQVQALDRAQGSILWENNMIGTATTGANFGFDMIKIAPSGDIILTGVYGESLSIQQQLFTRNALSTGFIMSLNPVDGTLNYIRHLTGSNQMELFGLTIDDANNIYFSGNAFETDSLNLEGINIEYTNTRSAFIIKLDPTGKYQWSRIFESTGGPEPKSIIYDKVNNLLHYVATDYESSEKGSRLGALRASDGNVEWERNMRVPGFFYISYASWIDYTDNSIYYSVWGKTQNTETSLIIDGKTFKDRINTYTYFHKFSLDGVSQYISPSPFTSIGDIAVVNPNKIIMQTNYQTSINVTDITVGIFDPANYPAPFAYIKKDGVYLSDGVTFSASSDKPDVTYQWLWNNEPIANATQAVFTPAQTGSYSVEISDGLNCPVRTRSFQVEDTPSLALDSLVLVDLYNGTQGSNWYLSTNWLTGPLTTWHGVSISGGRVTGLQLGNNNLTGMVPTSFDQLTGLQFLYLEGNNLSGDIPPTFWNASNLIEFVVHDNPNLTITLDPVIGKLTALQVIRAFNTRLVGTIPVELANATSLMELNIANAKLEGLVPNEIWQLPKLQVLNIGFNKSLEVTLPANLGQLTQFREIGIAKAKPLAVEFPEAFYQLINLESLDLGGHKFTGKLDARIGNLTKLKNLWIWDNRLEGDFPAEILNAPLVALSISGNEFTSIPDFTVIPTFYHLEVQHNLLGFDDLTRYAGRLEIFNYSPQKTRPPLNPTVAEGGSLTLQNYYRFPGNQYQWSFNLQDSIAQNIDFTISGAGFDDLGQYYCIVSNPALPELQIITESYNVAFSGAPRSFTVDNSPGSLADFKSFYAAGFGTNAGDTIYVAGSAARYAGFVEFESPRIIYGPGYFLTENAETQATYETAKLDGIGFRRGSSGSELHGVDARQILVNNQSSIINDTLRNISISGNRLETLSLNDDCQNIRIEKNFINKFTLASTWVPDVSRSYQDIFVENNIIDTVTTVFARATAARNVMKNVVFDRNVIAVFTDSIESATVTNNYINDYQAAGNTASNNYDFATAAFTNASGLLNVDNDFIPTNTVVDAGAFSGTDPYILSGQESIPHIHALSNTGRIRFNVKAKNPSEVNISGLHYRMGQNGTVTDEGAVTGFEGSTSVDVLFRPRLGKATPGQTYNLMIWAEDESGLKSTSHLTSFTATTTTATGKVTSSSNQPVSNGEMLLFEVNQEGTAFDTLSTVLNSDGSFTFTNIVIGDYLALGKPDTNYFAGELPTYYQRIDLWEKADTLLLDETNAIFDIQLMAEPRPTQGEGRIYGTLEELFDDENTSTGRMFKVRERVSRAGVSVRRHVRSARSSEVTYEMVAFVYTNEFGEFDFTDLPPDTYRLNIQYPGYPMDPNSNIDITLGGNGNNIYTVNALVDEGKISVAATQVTGLFDDIIQSVNVYPNPATTEGISVEFLEDMELEGKIEFKLFDLQGNLAAYKLVDTDELMIERTVYLPLTNFQEGVYLLMLSQPDRQLGRIRIIIKK